MQEQNIGQTAQEEGRGTLKSVRTLDTPSGRLLFGLDWLAPAQGTAGESARPREEALREGASFLATRGGEIGIGHGPLPKNALSAAAAFDGADAALVLHFATQEGGFWWVLVRMDGENVPGWSDTAFATKDEALSFAEELFSLLPEDRRPPLLLEENPDASLSLLARGCRPRGWRKRLGRTLGEGRVVALKSYRSVKERGAVLAALLCCGSLLFWCAAGAAWDWLELMGVTPGARKLASERLASKSRAEAFPELHWGCGWNDGPDAASFAKAFGEFEALPLVVSGWKLGRSAISFSKQGAKIEAKYVKSPGAGYAGLPKGFALQGRGQKEASTSRHVALSRRKASPWKELLKEEEFRRSLLELGKRIGCAPSLSFSKQETKEDPAAGKIRCPWVKGKWSIERVPRSAVTDGFFEAVCSMPGLVLTSAGTNGTFLSVKGAAYARK